MKEECSKCGGPIENNRLGKYRYCKSCHNEYMRMNRPTHSLLSPLQKMKANARSYLNSYLKRGRVTKTPCAICKCNNVQAHHFDYNRPLKVLWLCNYHHKMIHKSEPLYFLFNHFLDEILYVPCET